MISDRLETSGVGLVLDAVQLAVGTRVRVSTGNDLLAQLRANLAVVALFLVLDAVAGCVVKAVTSVSVVHVLVAQNRNRRGAGLLESSLESTSGCTSGGWSSETAAEGLLRLLLLLLLGVVSELATLGLAKGRHRWVPTLVASLTSRGQVLVRGRWSVQEITVAPAAPTSTRWCRCAVQVVQASRQDTTAQEGTPNNRFAYHCDEPDLIEITNENVL